MRKLLPLILTIAIFIAISTISASAASAWVSGPSSVESGSEVTFSVQASGSEGITGLSGTLVPESGIVITSVSGCPSGWMSASNTNAISIAGTNAVTSLEVVVRCKVTGDVGSTKTLTLSGAKISDSNGADTAAGSPSKTITIAAPKSGENNLASLSISGHPISFSAGTTSYDIGKVPFETKSLNISATAKDPAASVSISGNSLVVGDNYVKVNVTAANGSVKTYTIKVNREQDPNYVPGSDGTLSELTISHGDLSPVFDSKVKEYVVYVPFEVDVFSAMGKANAELAKEVKNVEDQKLEIGVNEIKVVCTAEDDSVTEYTIYVVRMDEFGGKDTVGLPASLIDLPVDEPTDVPVDETKGFVITPLIAGGIGLVCLLIGFGIGALVFKKKKAKAPVEEKVPEILEIDEYEDLSNIEKDDDVNDLVNKYLDDE